MTKYDESSRPGPIYLPNVSRKETVNKFSTSSSVEKRGETQQDLKRKFPGPGQYENMPNHRTTRRSPAFSMGRKRQSAMNKTQPGPLEYSPEVSASKRKFPCYGMGSQKQRETLVDRAKLESPGPCAYSLQNSGKNSR